MGRAKWRELWRWKRVNEKRLSEQVALDIKNLADYGSTWPSDVRQRIINRICDPPLLMPPL